MATQPVIHNPDITIGGQKPDTSVKMDALPYYKGDYGMNTSNPATAQIVVPEHSIVDSDSHRIVDFGPKIGIIAIPYSLSDQDVNELGQHIFQESKKYQQRGK
jgi:hypothetical protein